jgi:hypothetical protein
MLQGVQKHQLETIGKYRAVVQRPGERRSENAVIFNTYPPWKPDYSYVKKIKQHQANPRSQEDKLHQIKYTVGPANNAGGETHRRLLGAAKKRLEQDREGVQVKLLHQDTGSDRPDGEVILPDGATAHLEAEHSTLSKPVKVLTNYQRAIQQDLECIFVVQQGNAKKLENILSDPVNRRGNDHEDSKGSYSYYTSEGGEFTDTDLLKDGDYRIIEITDDGLEIHNESVEAECPELETLQESELEQFCLYREEDGYCTTLGQHCVLTETDD